MHIPIQIRVAAGTALVVGGLTEAVLPPSPHTGPVSANDKALASAQQVERTEARRKAMREADSEAVDRLRPAEVRPAEGAAGKLLRYLLRP